jgi:hypothetical protein
MTSDIMNQDTNKVDDFIKIHCSEEPFEVNEYNEMLLAKDMSEVADSTKMDEISLVISVEEANVEQNIEVNLVKSFDTTVEMFNENNMTEPHINKKDMDNSIQKTRVPTFLEFKGKTVKFICGLLTATICLGLFWMAMGGLIESMFHQN